MNYGQCVNEVTVKLEHVEMLLAHTKYYAEQAQDRTYPTSLRVRSAIAWQELEATVKDARLDDGRALADVYRSDILMVVDLLPYFASDDLSREQACELSNAVTYLVGKACNIKDAYGALGGFQNVDGNWMFVTSVFRSEELPGHLRAEHESVGL